MGQRYFTMSSPRSAGLLPCLLVCTREVARTACRARWAAAPCRLLASARLPIAFKQLIASRTMQCCLQTTRCAAGLPRKQVRRRCARGSTRTSLKCRRWSTRLAQRGGGAVRHRCRLPLARHPAAARKAAAAGCLQRSLLPSQAARRSIRQVVFVDARADIVPCTHIIIPQGLPSPQAAAAGRRPRLSVAPRAAPPPHERHTDPHELLNVDGAPLMSDPGDLGR